MAVAASMGKTGLRCHAAPASLGSPEGHQPSRTAVPYMLLPPTGNPGASPLPAARVHPSPLPKCLHLPKLPLPAGLLRPSASQQKALVSLPGGQVSCSWLIQMERDQGQHSTSPPEPAETHAGVCAKLPCFLALHNPRLCPGASKHHGRTSLWEMSS